MIEKEVYHSGRLVTACFSGVVTMQEIQAYFYWLVNNHESLIAADFSQLIYSSNLEKIDIKVTDIHRISHLNATVGRQRGEFKSALVVPNRKIYWMANLHKTLSKSSGITTRIFKDIDDAFVWLDFDNPLKND